tara:strand:- start:87 stop:383 length:297 start_codon:yes stop_codon:yes gene_type:complete
MDLHVFTHAPVKLGNGAFAYDSKTGCPLSENNCGSLCDDYIRYSPCGTWNVTPENLRWEGALQLPPPLSPSVSIARITIQHGIFLGFHTTVYPATGKK